MADTFNDSLEETKDETSTVTPEKGQPEPKGHPEQDGKVEEAPVATETDESTADEPKTIPFKKYQEEVSKRNSEAQNLRQRLKSFESQVSTVQAEKETIRQEREVIAAERDALKEKLQAHELERAVITAASDPKVGARSPAKLVKLVDRGNITFNEDGTVEGIENELKRLKKEWSELFISASADAGQSHEVDAFDMNALLRAKVGRG